MSHDHQHDSDSYFPGSVYEVIVRTKGGFLLRSTPLLGEEVGGFIDLLKSEHWEYLGFQVLPTQAAKELLERDAEHLRTQADELEKFLVKHHRGFQNSVEGMRDRADNLERRATFLTSLK
ncbi:MAG: hypothetical protein ABA06_01175 [Parcubacteria bacterium C7867-001]|nr:MAG: hypothetical protein ABA06_01175 [Parcubacteria bacterium C7867-001]